MAASHPQAPGGHPGAGAPGGNGSGGPNGSGGRQLPAREAHGREPHGRQPHLRAAAHIQVASDRGVFMISVAAELAGMHPQTLRMYESRGLIEPKRSPKGTRLYSHADVERLKRIQEMTAELGLNLAGVERVFELEATIDAMTRRVRALERRASELQSEVERLEALRRELRAEIVPYVRGGALVRVGEVR